MLTYRTCAILALTLTMTAAHPPQPSRASLPGTVTFEVTSVPRKHVPGQIRGEPIEFEMNALNAQLKRAAQLHHKTTPYTVTVSGREAYAMFRQTAGRDILHVEVHPTDHNSCQSTAALTLLVVRGDSCSGAIMHP